MTKKILIVLTMLIYMISMIISVHAEEKLELDKNGSITLSMECEGVELDGGSISVYLIGLLKENDGKVMYEPIEELAEEFGPLDRIDDSGLANKAAQLAGEKKLYKYVSEIQKGKAVFGEVPVGLYVVVQEDGEATKGYSQIHSFLISVPQKIEGKYVYEIVAAPKVSVSKDDDSSSPEESSVPEESSEPEESSASDESSIPTVDSENPKEPDEPSLPQTGQLKWPIPVLVVVGLSLFALGWFLKYGKKNNHEK